MTMQRLPDRMHSESTAQSCMTVRTWDASDRVFIVSRAPATAQLGFQSSVGTYAPLHALRGDGGVVPRTMLVVLRKFPALVRPHPVCCRHQTVQQSVHSIAAPRALRCLTIGRTTCHMLWQASSGCWFWEAKAPATLGCLQVHNKMVDGRKPTVRTLAAQARFEQERASNAAAVGKSSYSIRLL